MFFERSVSEPVRPAMEFTDAHIDEQKEDDFVFHSDNSNEGSSNSEDSESVVPNSLQESLANWTIKHNIKNTRLI